MVRITGTVTETGPSHLAYAFVFEKDRAGRWTEVANGRMSTVHVSQDSAGRMEAMPMPEKTRVALS